MSINLDALISYIYKMAFVGKSIVFPQGEKKKQLSSAGWSI